MSYCSAQGCYECVSDKNNPFEFSSIILLEAKPQHIPQKGSFTCYLCANGGCVLFKDIFIECVHHLLP